MVVCSVCLENSELLLTDRSKEKLNTLYFARPKRIELFMLRWYRLNLDSTWSETGDRYLLKLFRDYMLHPCTDDGRPWVDLAHIVACLNRLDTASQDKVCVLELLVN